MNTDQPPRPEIAGHTALEVIGVGATATVWSGRDAVDRPVAIKVPHERSDAVDLRQGEIERHVLQAVRHEHLVALRDVVGLADGRTALVFDQVRGASLDSTVAARGRLRPGECVTALAPIAGAVSALHAAGGIHGDISARNVLITAQGKPLLTDLGAARLAGAGAGAVHGSPGFVAPEVRDGEAPGEASDVFALGALAWFALTGNGAPDTMMRLDPETIISHVGPQLAPVVGACIDPDPSRRPTAAELGALFFRAARAEPIEVVVGADEATALTNRLRLDAAADPPAPPLPGRLRTACARVRSACARLRPRRPVARDTRRARSIRLPSMRVSDRRWPLLAVGLAVSVALVAAWALTTRPAALGLAGRTGPSQAPSGLSSPSRPGPGAGEAATPGAGADPTRVASVGEHPGLVLQELADRRSAALTRRDVAALTGVHRAGADSSRQDTHIIERLRAQGQVYSGLRLSVADALVIRADATRNPTGATGNPTGATGNPTGATGNPTGATGNPTGATGNPTGATGNPTGATRNPTGATGNPATAKRTGTPATEGAGSVGSEHAVIRARVDVSSYTVTQPDGTRLLRPAARGASLDFGLVRTRAGWRIESISDPRAR